MPHRWLLVLAAVLAAALAILGTFQYRWIDEVSIAQERRERGAMELSARRFGDELDREINRAVVAFQGSALDEHELARRYEEWVAGARDARLLSAIYAANANELQRFDPRTAQLVTEPWPSNLAPLRDYIAMISPGAAPGRRPLVEEIPALLLPMRPRPPQPEQIPLPPEEGGRRPGEEPPPIRNDGPPDDDQRPEFAEPLTRAPRTLSRRERDERRQPLPQFCVAVIDRDYLEHSLFPELARMSFSPGEDVAVLEADRVVFRTNAAWPRDITDIPEVAVPLMSMRPPQERDLASRWRIVVRKHGTSLANVVATSRTRNLVLAFAILFLLAASFALVAVLARRADRLRRQQLEFVAGITHELNTPLAALSSAGQNLADGIISEPPQVAKYGAMIVRESRRLIDMVGQVLDFAGIQARSAPRRVEPVDVSGLIDDAVAHCRWLAEEAGVKLETQVASDLPAIAGDESALERAVQNLIANAIRHGGDGEWVGVRAERSNGAVAITVEDRGRGIAARDLPHLFEPFYRGRDASRVRGTGLGLTIVHQIAAAHGGKVEVARRRQRGAAFTLLIPAGQNG
ncbi:MAG: two-component system, OmpR family, phosphate regulon sensor histidine kinase PhoR [Acidobacteriota bacterium]|jgi:signal transduction histidine kinase|nr:two-component system, OmpR family, phosphate regulon sensor histidine kinase PhoR [Acidobacteriota bacterium]